MKADPDTRPGYNVHSVSTHVGVLIKVGHFRKARKKSPSVLHHHSTKCLRGGNQHKTEDLYNELTVKMNSLKQDCGRYGQVKLARIYTERKSLCLKVRFPQRKEFSKYFKESESEDVLNFIKTEFQQWLDGKIDSLQTKDVADQKKKVSSKPKQTTRVNTEVSAESKDVPDEKEMVSSKLKQTTRVNPEVSAESTDKEILMSPELVSTDTNTDTKGLSFEDFCIEIQEEICVMISSHEY